MKPKKSLGQNFLKDKTVLDKIIEAADLKADNLVIEIGSGNGILTEELIKHAGKVIAIEVDKNLATTLDSRFRGNDKVEIINADILKINLPELISKNPHPASARAESTLSRKRERGLGGEGHNYKVVANIPYYITSPIIQLFLETQYPPKEMILMVQKEVAERICAKPGNMSVLAVSVQYYAKPELLFYVDKKSFWPMPEVDSAIIRITPKNSLLSAPSGHLSSGRRDGDEETKKFFRVVKAGFAAKRKMLANNLSNSLHLDKKIVEEKLKKASLSETSRAQELSVEDWKKIADHFRELLV